MRVASPRTETVVLDVGAVRGAATAELVHRVDALDGALAVGGARLDPVVVEEVGATIDRVRERLALGVDHTVVALVGGTGSGKSSLFNAVSGLEFADVGVRRPTTSRVTACVWGGDGDALLDWIGVAPEDRIERESVLDGDAEAALRGLVLLDLPDHDSVAPEHRVVVDRVLPQVDLVVWVVDPQKYADDALHSGYLRRLTGRDAAMMLVLNQVDTVPQDVRSDLVADVRRLLVEDGLPDVPVHEASAATGEGVAGLREVLAEAVARRSVAAVHADAEVADAARTLRTQVAAREPAPSALAIGVVVDRLAAAADAAARAGHNLNKLIIRGTCFNAFQHHFSRFKCMYYSNLHGYAGYINNSLACLLHAAYLIIFKLRQLLAGNNLGHSTQSRFHNAACSTEDNCGTGTGS